MFFMQGARDMSQKSPMLSQYWGSSGCTSTVKYWLSLTTCTCERNDVLSFLAGGPVSEKNPEHLYMQEQCHVYEARGSGSVIRATAANTRAPAARYTVAWYPLS